jgi:SAM-dependent methyltransferase
MGAQREHPTGNPRRTVQAFEAGDSTAVPSNVAYRLAKLRDLGILRGRWLDCGCADGGYTAALVEQGATEAVGVDPDEERISRARKRGRDRSAVQFLCASAEALPFPDATFDGVLLNEVLEHVRDEVRTLGELRRVLRPGGYLAIMSPNRWFPFEGHGMRIGRITVNVPVPFLPWIPHVIARHVLRARNYWPHELRDLVRSQGFTIRQAGFVLPIFEVYPWLPAPVIRQYRRLVPVLERTPLLRRFGVSNLVVAQKQDS